MIPETDRLIVDATHEIVPPVSYTHLYVLAPVGDKNGTIYVPTDSEKIIMRRTISKEEAERLIDELPQIELCLLYTSRRNCKCYR